MCVCVDRRRLDGLAWIDHQELGIAEVVADALLLRSDADDEGNGGIRYAQQH